VVTSKLRVVGDDLRRTSAPVDRLAAALQGDGLAVGRLGNADTSVKFEVTDREEWSCTLLADRHPPAVVDGGEPAEIVIELTAAQFEALTLAELSLSNEIVEQRVGTHGPVRKVMTIGPQLRGLLREPGSHTAESRRGPLRQLGVLPEHAPRAATGVLAIETREVRTGFGSHQVLDGASLAIPEGAASVVLGPSGAGKSVLIKHIIGLLAPDEGDVLVRGRALRGMSAREILTLRRDIGVMFQDGALYSSMTVFENVAFPLHQHSDLGDRDVREVVMHHLQAVGLESAANKLPGELSGGMKKRAGLARSLVLEPSILLCDEPDSGLDPVRTSLLGELLVARHEELGGTLIVVTHNVPLARLLADHVSLLYEGKILESGSAGDVFSSQTPFVSQFLAGDVSGPLGMD
jgi:phospholipid/cholesterol/gamma-HCH transport system ATP-binding protein